VLLAARASRAETPAGLLADLDAAITGLAATRPTAVNLFWALERVRTAARQAVGLDSIRRAVEHTAMDIHDRSIRGERRLSEFGAALVPHNATVLTHCNTGPLATGGYGTAVGVIRMAHAAGKVTAVFADETRPLLQGARLTAWELSRAGIPVTVIVDGAAAALMAAGRISCVIVGADRIARNGDTANKIGTYGLAVLAQAHQIPFYVAAPTSTVDLSLPSGGEIPVEVRDEEEVRQVGGMVVTPPEASVYNPAFDITPARLVSAVITDYGIALPPYTESLPRLCAAEQVPV
jgi:methylthioribose-1-phosphate isomerase